MTNHLFNAAKLLPDQSALAGQQFAYAYDDIGNRTTARYGGDSETNAGPDREISYDANALNQYTEINHPQTADILGLSQENVGYGVTVTGQLAAPDQQGDRFRAEVQASNPTGEWFDVKVSNDGGNPHDSQGSKWIPAALTAPDYDDDGNLLNDGRWRYTWDAENRLTRLTPTPAALAGGHPHTILEFSYDHLSRRLRKRVLDGSNGNAVLSDRRFLYDGWNLIAEFEADPQNTLDPVAYHAWTNDLSGTPQGAGGVGGLYASLLKSDNGTWENFFPSYDGNGNIIAWIDKQGQVAQRLDYDAFGNQLTKQGTLPGGIELNFGFSTKYQDQETGLLYYGYRYYDPVTGRWPSRDPIGERGGINLYGMVGVGVSNGGRWTTTKPIGAELKFENFKAKLLGYPTIDFGCDGKVKKTNFKKVSGKAVDVKTDLAVLEQGHKWNLKMDVKLGEIDVYNDRGQRIPFGSKHEFVYIHFDVQVDFQAELRGGSETKVGIDLSKIRVFEWIGQKVNVQPKFMLKKGNVFSEDFGKIFQFDKQLVVLCCEKK